MKPEVAYLIKSNVVISAYLITIFLVCIGIISIVASIFNMYQDSAAVLIMGSLVFIIVGSADIILVVKKHWSLSLLLWVIPLLLGSLFKAICKKQTHVEFEMSMPKNIAYSAIEYRYKNLQKC